MLCNYGEPWVSISDSRGFATRVSETAAWPRLSKAISSGTRTYSHVLRRNGAWAFLAADARLHVTHFVTTK
jgi:hypothetical protein